MKIKIKEILEQKGLTIRQAAELCGVPKSTIGDICDGASPRLDTLEKIAQGLGLHITDLFDSPYKQASVRLNGHVFTTIGRSIIIQLEKSIDKTCVCYYYINKHTFTKEKGAVHTYKELIIKLLDKIEDEQFLKEIYTLLVKHIKRAGG